MAAVLQWTLFAAYCVALVISAEAAPAAAALASAPSPLPVVPAPAPKPVTLHDKVVAALRAANHYGALSGFLDSTAANSIIKEGTTLFAPDDGAFSGMNMNSSSMLMTTLDYHVATEVYSYQQLSNMALNTTIPTAAPNVVIFVTSTGKNGLRLDNVAITDADIYSDGQISVQGVSAVMDAAKYNAGLIPPAAAPAPLVKHVPAPAPAIITTPTTPSANASAGTTPTKNAAPALSLNKVLPVFAISALVALL